MSLQLSVASISVPALASELVTFVQEATAVPVTSKSASVHETVLPLVPLITKFPSTTNVSVPPTAPTVAFCSTVKLSVVTSESRFISAPPAIVTSPSVPMPALLSITVIPSNVIASVALLSLHTTTPVPPPLTLMLTSSLKINLELCVEASTVYVPLDTS